MRYARPMSKSRSQVERELGMRIATQVTLGLAAALFAAAAAYAARRLRAQHASSLGDAFARQDGRAGAGADA